MEQVHYFWMQVILRSGYDIKLQNHSRYYFWWQLLYGETIGGPGEKIDTATKTATPFSAIDKRLSRRLQL